jgi:RNA polymerase sigma-70 factor, ECF subfamily
MNPDMRRDTSVARDAAVQAARDSYGRLLAWLARQWRDIGAAEDALGDAFASALERWPRDGVPSSPEGWLMTVAKRNLLIAWRRQRPTSDLQAILEWPVDGDPDRAWADLPDDRLRLMFVCAHPAIDATMRSALMLQTVLGVDAALIAAACLVSVEAMTKRLVRVKTKIKLAGIRFESPGSDELAERLSAVLEAIYGAYALDWGHPQDQHRSALAAEALFLAQLVAARLPDEPEAMGLAALLCMCEARRPARLDAEGGFVPLDQQDPQRWNRELMRQANDCLAHAAAMRTPGPYQYEAAIQAAHCHRAFAGATPWAEIVMLYERLLAIAPTVGARIGYAMALSRARDDASLGLRTLDAIAQASVQHHQPWWAARAHLLACDGRSAAAADAYAHALELTAEPALRRFLSARLAEVAPTASARKTDPSLRSG